MIPDIKKVESILKELDIEIYDHFYLDDDKSIYGFLCYKLVLHYVISSKEIVLCFHVNTEPEYVSNVILGITNIIKDTEFSIDILSSFSYDNNGNFITGEDAVKVFEEEKEKTIIENFVSKQNQIHYLLSTEGYAA